MRHLVSRGLAALLAFAAAPPARAQTMEGPAQLAPMIETFREAWRRSPDAPVRMSVPLDAGLVEFPMPQGLVPAVRVVYPQLYSIVFLPDGETPEAWTRQILVMSGAPPAPMTAPTPQLVEDLFRPRDCIGATLWEPLGEIGTGGPNRFYTVLSGCPELGHVRGHGQYNLLLVARSDSDFFLLNYAVRSTPFPSGRPPIDAAGAREAIARLLPILVCRDAAARGCAEIWAREEIRRRGGR